MNDRLGQMRTKKSCRAKTKNGKPCQAAATKGGLCFFHANPKKASELGQIGGRKNRRRSVEMDSLPTLNNAMAIRAMLQRIISETYSSRLSPRTASTLGPLLNGLLRVIEATDYEQRLSEIERRIVEGLNQSDTSVPKMQEKIEQLEKELAQARPSSNLDRQTKEPAGTSVGQAVSHHGSQNT
jgi:hypothetical protein